MSWRSPTPSARVVLINPRNAPEQLLGVYAPAMQPVVPTGLAYLAAVLRQAGHQVWLLDHYLTADPLEAFVRRVAALSPEVVGLSVLTPAASAAVRLSSRLRALLPDCFVVWGNIHASVFADEILRQGTADAVVRGEGEWTLLELVNRLARGESLEDVTGLSYRTPSGDVAHNEPRAPLANLDSLPYPAFDLLELKRYVAPPFLGWMEPILPIQASRGCRFSCAFCSQEVMSPTFRCRSVAAVVDEMEFHHRKYGISYMGFLDANFPADRDYALEFAERFRMRGLHKRIRWLTETRVDLIDEPLMGELAKAGLRLIMFGFESGSQTMLNSFGKRQSIDASLCAMEAARRWGVAVLGLFLLGMPGETVESAEETVALALRLDPDFAKFNLAVPYPGSSFFVEWRAKNPGPLDFDRFSAWLDQRAADRVLYAPEGMTSSQLLSIRDAAMRRFYLRPRFLLRHVARGTLQLPGMLKGVRVFGESVLRQMFMQS